VPAPAVGRARIERDLRAAGTWNASMAGAASRITIGRGTPDDVKQVTQSLIDAGKLPPEGNPKRSGEDRIRQMQWQYGIGVDCAGYTSQASPASQGKSPTQAGTNNVVNPPFGLLAPSAPAYKQVSPALGADGSINAKPGDIISLKDHDPTEPGHFVTVYDNKRLSDTETAKLKASASDPSGFLTGNGAGGKIDKGLVMMEVDAAWGASGDYRAGGVQRHTWLFNADSGKWAEFDPKAKPSIQPTPAGPYDHTVSAVYRPQ
jgi:hypothetical protein